MSQPKDFRPRESTRPPRNESLDVAEATQPLGHEDVATTPVEEVRDISSRFAFGKDFTGTDPEKNFRPRPVDADREEPDIEEVADPKDLSAPEFAPSSELQTQTASDSSANLVKTAPAAKVNTPPKASGSSTPSS